MIRVILKNYNYDRYVFLIFLTVRFIFFNETSIVESDDAVQRA